MEARRLSLRSFADRRVWLGNALLLAFGAVAYRPLLWNAVAFTLPTHSQIQGWLFRPSQLPTFMVIGVAAWFAWRRRARLLALPIRSAPLTATFFIAAGTALFVWAHMTRAADLFLPSLAANLLGFVAATRGRPGCRAIALPALVLLLGLQIPAPLQDEITWRLQLASAQAAGWFVRGIGGDLSQSGVILRAADHSFHVIDGCSGVRGIEILTLVALIVRELFASAGWRAWLLLPLAPVLGFALNVLRVAYVATSSDPEALAGAQGDHTPQGLAVLITGTLILYGVGLALATLTRRSSPAFVGSSTQRAPGAIQWLAAGWLAILVMLAIAVRPFESPSQAAARPKLALPEHGSGWVSEPLAGDPLFFGAGGQVLHRRYQPESGGERVAEESVEVFAGFEEIGSPTTNPLLSSKLALPGPDWNIERSSRTTLWILQRDADLTIASRQPGGQYAVVYTWRSGDLGLWRESWRSLLALDASPLRREQPRRAVRLIAFAPYDGSLVLDRAKQRLDAFITRFREELGAF